MKAGIVETLSLIALAGLIVCGPARAAEPHMKGAAVTIKNNPALMAVPAESAPTAPVGVMTDAAIAKFGNLTQAQRDQMVKQYAQKLKAMTPEQRKAFFAENQRRWNALTPAQKKDLQDKLKKESAEYIAAHKAEWDRNVAEEKKINDAKTKEFVARIPGIERAVLEKYRQLRKTHGKDYAWHLIIQDAGHGGHITPQ